MAAKRPAGTGAVGGDGGAPPPAKRVSLTAIPPLDIGPACGEDDLNIKVLQVQNKKLWERLRERNFAREQLETRVEEAENRIEQQRSALSSLPRHMQAVRDRLIPLLPEEMSLDGLARVWEEAHPEMCLEEGFRCILTALRSLAPREKEEREEEEEREREKDERGEDRQLEVEKERDRLSDEVRALQSRCEELVSRLADARFDLERSMAKVHKLERYLAEALEATPTTSSSSSSSSSSSTTDVSGSGAVAGQQAPPTDAPPPSGGGEKVTNEEVTQLTSDLEEANAVAESRLKETAQLTQQIVELRTELELVKEVKEERDVTTSTPYLSLQAQFSVLQQEHTQLRGSVEELKTLLYEARAQHFSQLDEIRAEEVKYENEMREEMSQLEALLATSKRDYELLRMEFEKRIAANDQAAPLAKELQVTVNSLQKTTTQLKSEIERYKIRAHKAEAKLQEEANKPRPHPPTVAEGGGGSSSCSGGESTNQNLPDDQQQLLSKMKSLQEEKKVLEEKLEVFGHSSEEEREKAVIMVSEKRARGQVEDLKRKCDEMRRDYEKRKEHMKEETARRSKALAEDNKQLQRELVAKRQESQALVKEMECTAQAFEEVQEQNLRLLQQIREKDDANFKVISERIKVSSLQKLLMEEKELLHSQISNLTQERNRMSEVMARLEDRDKHHEGTLVAMEKDIALKQQTLETFKRKAQDSVQAVQNLQLQVSGEERERETHREKTREILEEKERAAQQLRRSQEEVSSLKRKLEKYKLREWASASDEVLLEEIRTYKVKLNCPCCSTRLKDTVLTKCFHVFCSECIRSRYDSRLRKCPKCGAAFGANDFHKLYLS